MNQADDLRAGVELTVRLHELVQPVGVEGMTLAGVRGRVYERARRRRIRRALSSAALVTITIFVSFGAWSAAGNGTADRLLVRPAVVPAAPPPGPPAVSGPSPSPAPSPAPTQATPSPQHTGSDDQVGGRGGDSRDESATRGGPTSIDPR